MRVTSSGSSLLSEWQRLQALMGGVKRFPSPETFNALRLAPLGTSL